MTGVLTWKQLHDLKCDELLDAAEGWGAVSTQADAARDRISDEMVRSLEATQKGMAAPAAVGRLRRLDRNYDYIRTECGLVRTTVNSLVYELVGFQSQLKDALDDAASLGFTVAADGSVSYPAGGKNLITNQPIPGGSVTGGYLPLSRPPSLNAPQPGLLNPNPNFGKAQDIADRILRALTAAREADEHFSKALNRLKAEPGLDVTESTWKDAAGDLAAVREVSGDYLKKTIPTGASPADRHDWWTHLSATQRDEYLAACPDILGNLDGIPAAVRDEANRDNLRLLMGKLAGEDGEGAKAKLDGLRSIDTQLRATPGPGIPPMYLLGIGDQGNGRAIVAFGNPDESRNVSAYVPGLGTSLDADFARNDIQRARDTVKGARVYDPSSASIVWLGYDAPQLPAEKLADNLAVMSRRDAVAGAPAYNQFMAGISATNENADPHITAIGHSYGSLTVGQAAQRPGGIPGADDIILVGSPGTGAHTADQLGVGEDHVYIGAAKNDVVTKLPNPVEGVGALEGFKAGFRSGSAQGVVPGLVSGLAGAFTGYEVGDAVTDESQIYFGTDPANHEFGARRFATGDGPPLFDFDPRHLELGDIEAHSNYFNPEKDRQSADNIARIVAGRGDKITTQEPR
ncbi:alpha/beta hydrolase [Streptomyces sp. TLI_146]|uniref:alpha/beta hydrolase n=1 Tax=Streptomyces sp. TLI_146 TaxID=1938858 RepID=UPI000C7122B0|nr:alpha/beta hydrolase [Streptomyces sp. TLI_146]PKV86946.1 alpha/beta hydrolase family protein [Streptomyces sp. TLI_146]